jgi:hypothetical protein
MYGIKHKFSKIKNIYYFNIFIKNTSKNKITVLIGRMESIWQHMGPSTNLDPFKRLSMSREYMSWQEINKLPIYD